MFRHDAAVESEMFSELMGLVEVMARNATDDGMPRQPGLVVISTKGVAWIVEVIDRETQLGFAVMRFELDDAIYDANALLKSGNAPWSRLKRRDRAD